jgi:hypothetical protein
MALSMLCFLSLLFTLTGLVRNVKAQGALGAGPMMNVRPRPDLPVAPVAPVVRPLKNLPGVVPSYPHQALPYGYQIPYWQLKKFPGYELKLVNYMDPINVKNLNAGPHNAFRIGVISNKTAMTENMPISSNSSFTFKWFGRHYAVTVMVTDGHIKGISNSSVGVPGHETFTEFKDRQVKYNIGVNFLQASII